MERECGATRSIIDEFHSSDMIKGNVKLMLLEVLLMMFILRITQVIK